VAGFVETIRQEAAVLKAAPWSVITIIAATVALTILAAQWVYSARFDAMSEEIRLKDAQLALYSAEPSSSSEQPKPALSAPSASASLPAAGTLFSGGWAGFPKWSSQDPTKPDPNVIYK